MITRIATLAAASAASVLLLSACGQTAEDPTSNQIVEAGNGANTTTAATNVVLPPPIKNTVKYRCTGDNSVIEASFLADDLTVNLRPGDQPTAAPTVLKATTPGGPFEAEGYSLSGSGTTVTYKSPTGGSQSCRSGAAS